MADYTIFPSGNGKGWLCVSTGSLNSDNCYFIKRRGYEELTANHIKREPNGFKLALESRPKYIFKSPFDILNRFKKVVGRATIKKINDNTFKVGGYDLEILNTNTRGTVWKFIS